MDENPQDGDELQTPSLKVLMEDIATTLMKDTSLNAMSTCINIASLWHSVLAQKFGQCQNMVCELNNINAGLCAENERLAAKIAGMEPDAMFGAALRQTYRAISIREFSHELEFVHKVQTDEERLRSFLCKQAVFSDDGAGPLQAYIDCGYFVYADSAVVQPDGNTITERVPKVTWTGQEFILKLLRKEGMLS